MEALNWLMEMGRMGTRIAKYDSDKITKIREKIKVVFGRVSTGDGGDFGEIQHYS